MNVKITNHVDGVEAKIVNHDDETVEIIFSKVGTKSLGSVNPGESVKIGDREYIVLDHSAETTAVISKDIVKKMPFGSDGNYINSRIMKYLNGEFLRELVSTIGEDNIVEHTTNLVADDGTGKGECVRSRMALITTENYRRYRKYLPACGSSWWTATRVTFDEKTEYSRSVCFVGSGGILSWTDCGYACGVRPFCILKSSILVS